MNRKKWVRQCETHKDDQDDQVIEKNVRAFFSTLSTQQRFAAFQQVERSEGVRVRFEATDG
jgi:hypothetical protein